MKDEWILTTEATEPTYNHTRGDSPLYPCALCRALLRAKKAEDLMLELYKVAESGTLTGEFVDYCEDLLRQP